MRFGTICMAMLTLRQGKFVDAYVVSGNASEAARRAGYSEKTARVIGPENLQKPAVIAAVAARQAEYAAEFQITKDDVIAGVLAAIDMARKQDNPTVMIQGCSTLAKMLGFFSPEVSRIEMGANSSALKARVAALSDSDLLAMARGRN